MRKCDLENPMRFQNSRFQWCLKILLGFKNSAWMKLSFIVNCHFKIGMWNDFKIPLKLEALQLNVYIEMKF